MPTRRLSPLLLTALALLVMTAALAPRPQTTAAQSGGASIRTDKPQYRIGEPIQVCYTVPGPGPVTVTDIQGGVSQVIMSGNDDGTGGCTTGVTTPPPGQECFRLDYAGPRGSGSRQTCVQIVGSSATPPPTPVPSIGQLSITTDKSLYQVGDPIRLCYTVPGPGAITITALNADGSSRVVLSGNDDGRGDCVTSTMGPETGTRCMRLDYSGPTGASSRQVCVQVAGASTPAPTIGICVIGVPSGCNSAVPTPAPTPTPIELSPYPPQAEGIIVMSDADGQAYLLQDGQRHLVPDTETLNALLATGVRVEHWLGDVIRRIPFGKDVPSTHPPVSDAQAQALYQALLTTPFLTSEVPPGMQLGSLARDPGEVIHQQQYGALGVVLASDVPVTLSGKPPFPTTLIAYHIFQSADKAQQYYNHVDVPSSFHPDGFTSPVTCLPRNSSNQNTCTTIINTVVMWAASQVPGESATEHYTKALNLLKDGVTHFERVVGDMQKQQFAEQELIRALRERGDYSQGKSRQDILLRNWLYNGLRDVLHNDYCGPRGSSFNEPDEAKLTTEILCAGGFLANEKFFEVGLIDAAHAGIQAVLEALGFGSYSAGGKVVLAAANILVSAAFDGEILKPGLEEITKSAASPLLGRLIGEYASDKLTGLVFDVAWEHLHEEDIKTMTGSGTVTTGGRANQDFLGYGKTLDVKIALGYNPYTRYVTVVLYSNWIPNYDSEPAFYAGWKQNRVFLLYYEVNTFGGRVKNTGALMSCEMGGACQKID